MQYYSWYNSGGGIFVEATAESDARRISWYDLVIGDPLVPISDWRKPSLKFCDSGKLKRLGYMPDCVYEVIPFISLRAVKALSNHLTGVSLYPVDLQGAENEYFMVVVDRALDCIDRDFSEGKIRKIGKRKGLFSSISKWVFIESEVKNQSVFKIPDSDIMYYVSDDMVQDVLKAGLTGFVFNSSHWDESPLVS